MIIDLDHFPILAVCHDMERRRRFRRAPKILGWWYPRQDLDAGSFAFDMPFGEANESAIPRKIVADAWFELRGADRFEIQEQSFRLPNDEVLMLLTLPDGAFGQKRYEIGGAGRVKVYQFIGERGWCQWRVSNGSPKVNT